MNVYLEHPATSSVLFVGFAARKPSFGVTASCLSLRSAVVSLVSDFCFDIPQAFLHKLRASIGEPPAFVPERYFSAFACFGFGCLCGSQT